MKIYPIVFLMLLSGCYTTQPAIDKPAILVSREFTEPEYVGQKAIYWTDGIEYVCLLDRTEIIGGSWRDIRPGLKVRYWAGSWGRHYDNMGFNHFLYFLDKICIVGPATERELQKARVKLMHRKGQK